MRLTLALALLASGALAQTNTFPTSGNAGIGTLSPAVPLHVKTPGGVSAWMALDKPSAAEGGIQFMKAGATLFYLYSDNADNDALKIQATNLSGEGDATPRIHIPTINKDLYILESGGMLGVGLNNPTQRMDVSGRVKVRANGSVSAGMWLADINGGENSFIGNYDQTATSPFGMYAGGSWRLICDQTGKIGIGTTTPQMSFEVVGSGQIIRNAGVSSYTTLRLYNNTNVGNRSLEIDYSGSSYASALVTGGPVGESGSITTVGAYPLTLGTANTMRMTIREDGNVGIGTNNPQSKLDVRGHAIFETGGNPTIYTGTASTEQNRFLTLINSTGHTSASGLKAGGILVSDSYSFANPGKNDLVVKGNVGIGTASPDAKLSVKGQVHAQEVKVDLNGAVAPDYVFDKDYKLPSLDEIKSYIEKNNHLPEVPSAKEMEANGMNLGEMNLMLLKKVEELTLYIIQMKKEIDEIKQVGINK